MPLSQSDIDDACEAEERFDLDELEAFAAFERMKTAARKLPRSEIERHASVSRNNHHRCTACFTCACLAVLEAT